MTGDRSAKQIVSDIAGQVGVSVPKAEKIIGKVMQREILTEGVNQKMARVHLYTEKKLPEWDEFQSKVFSFTGNDDRAQFAAQAIKDGRHRPPVDASVLSELRSDGDAIEAARSFTYWAENNEGKPTVLQSAQTTSLHKLLAAYDAKCVLTLDRDGEPQMVKLPPSYRSLFDGEHQVFLVQHNWAKAFDKAEGLEGEVPMPFDLCAFEFQISDRRMIVLCRDSVASIFVKLTGSPYWYASRLTPMDEMHIETDEPGTFAGVGVMIAANIRAICIALDAEVAITEVIRAPHRLNHQREKQGKKPILDHHIINLTKRSRVEPLPSAGEHEARWHPRLHFRRGHWRHFSDHKTWIKWMLVGNPDLGFIDKEYRA